MEKKYKFTKNNTLAIKGIAIFMLLGYHCFSSVERLYGANVNFAPFAQEKVMEVCGWMQQCVGIFAFLSVYGLTLSMKKQYKDLEFSGKEATLFVVKRYLHLVFMFLIPYFLCFGVTYGLGYHRYNNSLWENVISAFADILCVGRLFGTRLLIPTWWYLSLEVMLIVFLPVVIVFYKKFGWLSVGAILILGTRWLDMQNPMSMYLFTAPLAVCFADQDIFARLKAWNPLRAKFLSKIFKIFCSSVMIVIMCMVIKTDWGNKQFGFLLGGIIPAVIIYWAYEFVIEIPVIRQILEFIGKYSGLIYYIHTFIRGVWLTDVTYSFPYAWQILLFVLGVSIAIAIAIELVRKVLHLRQLSGMIIGWVTGWAERTL